MTILGRGESLIDDSTIEVMLTFIDAYLYLETKNRSLTNET